MEGAGQPLQRACALVGQRSASRFRRFLSRSRAGETARFEVCHRSCIACSWHNNRCGCAGRGIDTVRCGYAQCMANEAAAKDSSGIHTCDSDRIFETLVCRVFRDMRRFLALDVSSHSRDEHKSPSRLKRTGIRLRDNRSPPPISHRDRPACRPKPTPEAEIVGAQHRSRHVRDGRPIHVVTAWRGDAEVIARQHVTWIATCRRGRLISTPAASPVRRYPTTVR